MRQYLAAFASAAVLSAGASIAQDAEPVTNDGSAAYGPVLDGDENARPPTPSQIPQPLEEAVKTALETSPLIAASIAASEGSAADLRGAKWLRYPNLSVDILATTGGSNVADTDGLAANLALEQPLFTGGSIAGRIDEARSNLAAAESGVGETRQALLLDITQAYFDVLTYDRQSAVLADGLSLHRDLEASIARRVAQQVSPAVDLALAQSRIAQLEADYSSAKESAEIARLQLFELVGAEVPAPALPQDVPLLAFESEAAALGEALACNPTLRARSSLVDAAEARYDTAKAELWPRLLFQLSQNELTGARAALVLRAQTGNGLSKLSNIDGAEAEIAQALAQLAQSDRQVRTLVRREFARYRSSQRSMEASTMAAGSAAELLESYKRQYTAGRRTWLDVLNALGEVVDARRRVAQDQVTLASSAALILALTCRWQPEA